MQKNILNGIGQGFMTYDALKDEDMFDALWENKIISIESTDFQKGSISKKGSIFIYPPQDWREKINEHNDNLWQQQTFKNQGL